MSHTAKRASHSTRKRHEHRTDARKELLAKRSECPQYAWAIAKCWWKNDGKLSRWSFHYHVVTIRRRQTSV